MKLEASCIRWGVLGAFRDWIAVQTLPVDSLGFVEMCECLTTGEDVSQALSHWPNRAIAAYPQSALCG
jgi:hypothetical protein